MTRMLSPTIHSPQCPTQRCYSDNSETKQRLQHQRLLGAPTQPDAEWHHPGVQGKHTPAQSSPTLCSIDILTCFTCFHLHKTCFQCTVCSDFLKEMYISHKKRCTFKEAGGCYRIVEMQKRLFSLRMIT